MRREEESRGGRRARIRPNLLSTRLTRPPRSSWVFFSVGSGSNAFQLFQFKTTDLPETTALHLRSPQRTKSIGSRHRYRSSSYPRAGDNANFRLILARTPRAIRRRYLLLRNLLPSPSQPQDPSLRAPTPFAGYSNASVGMPYSSSEASCFEAPFSDEEVCSSERARRRRRRRKVATLRSRRVIVLPTMPATINAACEDLEEALALLMVQKLGM